MIDPLITTTVRVGELPDAPFELSDNIPHEIGTELFRGTVQQLATVIGDYLGGVGGLAFNPNTVSPGGNLPVTTINEFMLVGRGTFHNVGGQPDIITTEELNVIASNGSYWSLAVEIPINVELAGITQSIRSGFTQTTPSENTVFDALALKANVDQIPTIPSNIAIGIQPFAILAAPTKDFTIPINKTAFLVLVNQGSYMPLSSFNTDKTYTFTQENAIVSLKQNAPTGSLITIYYQ